ncbi:MAG: hypothetical protein CMK59_08425 [Proteobacteria bacterium]|nr:hypothetical protein [Pseudomonadota bacterium]
MRQYLRIANVSVVDFGGLGYTPIEFQGLTRYEGWRLEQLVENTWQEIDQSVEGGDFWQAIYDESQSSYSLIFNLHNRGTNEYRLIRD